MRPLLGGVTETEKYLPCGLPFARRRSPAPHRARLRHPRDHAGDEQRAGLDQGRLNDDGMTGCRSRHPVPVKLCALSERRTLLTVLGLTFGLAVTVGNVIGAGIL